MSSTGEQTMIEELRTMASRVAEMRETSGNPGVDTALRHAEMYLFLALSNLGEPVVYPFLPTS